MFDSTDDALLKAVLDVRLKKRWPSAAVIGGKSAFSAGRPKSAGQSDKPLIFGMSDAAR